MNSTMRAAAFLDKGGVGKTTTIAHVGVALADDGYSVCLFDLAGKQGDLLFFVPNLGVRNTVFDAPDTE